MFKRNKRILSIVLFIVLSLGLIGCKKPVDQPIEIDTRYTDQLKLTTVYEGKDFLTEGIGEVTLSQAVDGDTAHFRGNGSTFTVRFLAINTPESTGRIDPWGKAASKFTKEKLEGATTIVLESEVINKPAEIDATGKRYLAYVWYKTSETSDFRLLNLEIVEQCYSQFTGLRSEIKYGDVFDNSNKKSHQTKKRIFGEKDPSYDYSNEVIQLTISYLKDNFDNYTGGSILKITARIMRINGSNLYLEDLTETYNEKTNEYVKAGIYMFSGYGSGLAELSSGSVITFNCQAIMNDTYGKQLTNPTGVKVTQNPDGAPVEVQTIPNTVTSLEKYEGFVVKLENILIKSKKIDPDDEGAYTIMCEMDNGFQVNLRIDKSTYPKYPYDDVIVGGRYDVIGGVSKFHDSYQIMIANKTGYQENDLLKK